MVPCVFIRLLDTHISDTPNAQLGEIAVQKLETSVCCAVPEDYDLEQTFIVWKWICWKFHISLNESVHGMDYANRDKKSIPIIICFITRLLAINLGVIADQMGS